MNYCTVCLIKSFFVTNARSLFKQFSSCDLRYKNLPLFRSHCIYKLETLRIEKMLSSNTEKKWLILIDMKSDML